MKRTISVEVGKGSVNHNSRKFKAANVDGERSCRNIDYCNEPIEEVYHRLFDEALSAFNARQTRTDRSIENYYEKIRTGKQEKPFHEVILQVGNKDDMSATGENAETAKQILDEYYRGFQQRNPTLCVFSAHLHMDEATPHLHIDFVPYTTGSKRGLETRVSLKQALAGLGFKGGTRGATEWSQWVQAEKVQLAAVMERHGIEWEQKGTHDQHLSVMDFKKQERQKEIQTLETQISDAQEEISHLQEERSEAASEAKEAKERLNELAPMFKDVEAAAAKYCYEPDSVLPAAGTLESGKSYRENKAMPAVQKLQKVLLSVYHSYLDVREKLRRMQDAYNRAMRKINALGNRLDEVLNENKHLRGIADKYNTLCRGYGEDSMESRVKKILDSEKLEQERRKAARRHQERDSR